MDTDTSTMNPLRASQHFLSLVATFCLDIFDLSVYAFLTAVALCALFFALTTLGPIYSTLYPLFLRERTRVTHWRFPFEFLKSSTRSRVKPQVPRSISRRWVIYTWRVLHTVRIGGISPVVLFLWASIPAVLVSFIFHQRRQALKARKAEACKHLLAKKNLHAAQKACEKESQPVDAIRSALKCSLCTALFTLPYTLSPCGHTFDYHCLEQFFRTAPPSFFDSRSKAADLPARQRFCPECRVEVTAPPALAWAVKIVAEAVAHPDAPEPLQAKSDPWKGFFRGSI
ncbi:hypothetical protein B0H15DRAFT_831142 [Mycena belliarum]|uniref:RING-type domain-containing protein n=1 Tax=Mycena belliarum TaxID=1033014 RepID=A0AAD6UCZ6_9AGAR|nr:hypothetical protein B0H15DRAFT_831142 [Mycena belliae]